jgi:phosphoribosylglycinamide formyltransferase 1
MSVLRIGVLASGGGTNLQALLDQVHGREAQVVGVVSDKDEAGALERARAAGVPTAVFPRSAFPDRPARDAAIGDWLDAQGVDLVVLAGYSSFHGARSSTAPSGSSPPGRSGAVSSQSPAT